MVTKTKNLLFVIILAIVVIASSLMIIQTMQEVMNNGRRDMYNIMWRGT